MGFFHKEVQSNVEEKNNGALFALSLGILRPLKIEVERAWARARPGLSFKARAWLRLDKDGLVLPLVNELFCF